MARPLHLEPGAMLLWVTGPIGVLIIDFQELPSILGRTEFLTLRFQSESRFGKAQTIYECEMALLFECM